MTARPQEVTVVHTRLLKCALAVDASRAYWREVDPDAPGDRADAAFAELWFGPKSLSRIKVLLSNFRARYDAFPQALSALRAWRPMTPDVRPLICHWHLQLCDPLYRRFTGEVLTRRRREPPHRIGRDAVIAWVERQAPDRWTMSTRIQFASKLLSAASAAGLVAGRTGATGPRAVTTPRVPDDALTYALYLLRGVDFAGTLLDNPYLASVGLDGPSLAVRLRALPGLHVRTLGDHLDVDWTYPDLAAWAAAHRPGVAA